MCTRAKLLDNKTDISYILANADDVKAFQQDREGTSKLDDIVPEDFPAPAKKRSSWQSLGSSDTASVASSADDKGTEEPSGSKRTSVADMSGGTSPRSSKVKRTEVARVAGIHCLHCNTTKSPEWRKGPDGHKSLCNACGLRYARRQAKALKRQQQQQLQLQLQQEQRRPSIPLVVAQWPTGVPAAALTAVPAVLAPSAASAIPVQIIATAARPHAVAVATAPAAIRSYSTEHQRSSSVPLMSPAEPTAVPRIVPIPPLPSTHPPVPVHSIHKPWSSTMSQPSLPLTTSAVVPPPPSPRHDIAPGSFFSFEGWTSGGDNASAAAAPLTNGQPATALFSNGSAHFPPGALFANGTAADPPPQPQPLLYAANGVPVQVAYSAYAMPNHGGPLPPQQQQQQLQQQQTLHGDLAQTAPPRPIPAYGQPAPTIYYPAPPAQNHSYPVAWSGQQPHQHHEHHQQSRPIFAANPPWPTSIPPPSNIQWAPQATVTTTYAPPPTPAPPLPLPQQHITIHPSYPQLSNANHLPPSLPPPPPLSSSDPAPHDLRSRFSDNGGGGAAVSAGGGDAFSRQESSTASWDRR